MSDESQMVDDPSTQSPSLDEGADDWGSPQTPGDQRAAIELEEMDELKRQRLKEQLAVAPYQPKSGNVAYCPSCAAPCDPEMDACPECGHTLTAARSSAKQNLSMIFIGGIVLVLIFGALILVTQRGIPGAKKERAISPYSRELPSGRVPERGPSPPRP